MGLISGRLLTSVCAGTLALLTILASTAACGEHDQSASEAGAQDGSASDYQRKLLENGLTAAEYQQAAFDVVRCHREAGATIEGEPHYFGDPFVPEPWWSARGQCAVGPPRSWPADPGYVRGACLPPACRTGLPGVGAGGHPFR